MERYIGLDAHAASFSDDIRLLLHHDAHRLQSGHGSHPSGSGQSGDSPTCWPRPRGSVRRQRTRNGPIRLGGRRGAHGKARVGTSAGRLPPVRARSAAPGRSTASCAAGHANAAAIVSATFPLDFKRLETRARSSARTRSALRSTSRSVSIRGSSQPAPFSVSTDPAAKPRRGVCCVPDSELAKWGRIPPPRFRRARRTVVESRGGAVV